MGVPVLAPIIQKSAAASESSSVFFISSSPTSRHVLRTRNLRVKQHQENFVRDCKWHFHHHQIRSMGDTILEFRGMCRGKNSLTFILRASQPTWHKCFLFFVFFLGGELENSYCKKVFSIASLPQPSPIYMKTAKLRHLILFSRVTY
jgi:hypothetical protein